MKYGQSLHAKLCTGLLTLVVLGTACGPGQSPEKTDKSELQSPAAKSSKSAAEWASSADPGSETRAEAGAVVATGLSFAPDADWARAVPTSDMRKAQYTLPGTAGSAELILFHFPGMGGMVQANLERWAGQMGATLDQSEVSNAEVNGLQLTTIGVTGTYTDSMRPGAGGAALPDYRMQATVIEGAGGPWFFKLVGPEETVKSWAASYEAMIQSVKKAGQPI